MTLLVKCDQFSLLTDGDILVNKGAFKMYSIEELWYLKNETLLGLLLLSYQYTYKIV